MIHPVAGANRQVNQSTSPGNATHLRPAIFRVREGHRRSPARSPRSHVWLRGDIIFIIASENDGGSGLVASGIVSSAAASPKTLAIARQTPRVGITIRRSALAKRRLGRSELKTFSNWNDGRPETELNFKLYRQATNKIIDISEETAAFLRGFS